MTDHASQRVLTIGHSTHDAVRLTDLLREHAAGFLVDVRSQPYSKFAPQFNRESLEALLREAGIDYLFLGDSLGGRPTGPDYYDADSHVLYDRVARSEVFAAGMTRLLQEAVSRQAIIMCAEENPTDCHRRLLVGRELVRRGISVLHIRGSGLIESDDDLETASGRSIAQVPLFPEVTPPAWRSTRSVSQRQPPSNSSEH